FRRTPLPGGPEKFGFLGYFLGFLRIFESSTTISAPFKVFALAINMLKAYKYTIERYHINTR
ncbi:hypothetical protein, partial [Pedobacter fastidiosus]|uniref:hypothetical protein n=1 Tax=Pedobacter fastidiosus TaxID=2765361 RepID=UPI001C9A522A